MQVVGYDTVDGGLYLSDGSDDSADTPDDSAGRSVTYRALEVGAELAYTLGERHCAGVVVDGRHRRCSEPAAPYCPDHTSTWVCARCTGSCLKDEMDCYDDHAVYLAAFAPDRFKVGVTKHHRLETRLREQGADRAAHVRTVSNGRIARELEAELSESVPVPDRVRVSEKRAGLGRRVDDDAWEQLLAAFDVHERFDFDYELDLTERPVAETLATGTVRGTKGRLLVLETGGSSYAVDMRDLVGYELEAGSTSRSLQSSLGAFG